MADRWRAWRRAAGPPGASARKLAHEERDREGPPPPAWNLAGALAPGLRRFWRAPAGHRARCPALCDGAYRRLAAEGTAHGSPEWWWPRSDLNDPLLPAGSTAVSAYHKTRSAVLPASCTPGPRRTLASAAPNGRYRDHANASRLSRRTTPPRPLPRLGSIYATPIGDAPQRVAARPVHAASAEST